MSLFKNSAVCFIDFEIGRYLKSRIRVILLPSKLLITFELTTESREIIEDFPVIQLAKVATLQTILNKKSEANIFGFGLFNSAAI